MSAVTDAVRALLDRRSDIELAFVRHRCGGRVHVIVPRDPDTRQELVPTNELSAEERFQAVLNWTRRPTLTLCGRIFLVYLDCVTGDYEDVDTFDDNDLCWSCHRVLGPEHSSRAFEHPRPTVESS